MAMPAYPSRHLYESIKDLIILLLRQPEGIPEPGGCCGHENAKKCHADVPDGFCRGPGAQVESATCTCQRYKRCEQVHEKAGMQMPVYFSEYDEADHSNGWHEKQERVHSCSSHSMAQHQGPGTCLLPPCHSQVPGPWCCAIEWEE